MFTLRTLDFCFVSAPHTHTKTHTGGRLWGMFCYIRLAPLLIAYWLLWSIGPTFSRWPENIMVGYSLAWTLTPPCADLEQTELETGGSTTSWAPCCDTGLDLPQRKSSPKVCINTASPSCQVRPTCSTCPSPGLQLARTAAGTFKCGPRHDPQKVGSWLIEPEDMQSSSLTVTKCRCHVEEKSFPSCPRWLALCWGTEQELPRSVISKSGADHIHNIRTLPAHRRLSCDRYLVPNCNNLLVDSI